MITDSPFEVVNRTKTGWPILCTHSLPDCPAKPIVAMAAWLAGPRLGDPFCALMPYLTALPNQ